MEDISSSFRPRMLPYPTATYIPCLEATPILYHQHASPLVEVFSVWIHNDVDNRHIPRKIAGKVYVVDEFENSYSLYDRKHEDFETVGGPNGDGTLSLHDPYCDDPASSDDDDYYGDGGGFKGMLPGSELSIEVDLTDILRGEIVRDTHTTSYESLDCYDKPCVARLGFATVYWATLRAAALTMVSISYVGDQDSLRGVYGSLFAYYGDYYGRFCKPDEEKYFRITLFDKPKHEPAAEIKRDALLDLARSVLAVPAHSSIVIEGCLWDADDKLIGIKAEFPVHICDANSLVLEDRIKVGVEFKLGQTP